MRRSLPAFLFQLQSATTHLQPQNMFSHHLDRLIPPPFPVSQKWGKPISCDCHHPCEHTLPEFISQQLRALPLPPWLPSQLPPIITPLDPRPLTPQLPPPPQSLPPTLKQPCPLAARSATRPRPSAAPPPPPLCPPIPPMEVTAQQQVPSPSPTPKSPKSHHTSKRVPKKGSLPSSCKAP